MNELTWGIPNWAWIIIIMLGIVEYQIVQLSKQAHNQYLFIMRQLGVNVTIPGEPNDKR